MAVHAVPVESESRLVRACCWSLYLTVAGLPAYVVRWHWGPLPTTLLETLALVTAALYAVARWRDGWRRPLATPLDIPIILLLMAGAIAVIVAKDHRTALGLYRAFFIEPVFIYYVAVDLLRKPERLGAAVLALAAGSSVLAALNIAAFARALVEHRVQVGSAPSAVYADANYVAMYLEPPVAMAAGLILFGSTKMWRQIGAAWLAVAGLALILTFSKGTYVALCVAGVVAIFSVRSRRLKLALAIAFLAAALLATRIPLIALRLSGTANSMYARLQLYRGAIEIIRGHPIFGLGIGGYSAKLYGVSPEPYPHNVWLTFWVETGLLGVVCFSAILLILFVRGWRAFGQTGGFFRPALWGSLVALILWTVHGLVDSPYWKNDMSVEFWILAATIVIAVGSMREAGTLAKVTAPSTTARKDMA